MIEEASGTGRIGARHHSPKRSSLSGVRTLAQLTDPPLVRADEAPWAWNHPKR